MSQSHVWKPIGGQTACRLTAITDAKSLGALLRAIDAFEGQLTTVAALKLSALFFTRPGELRHAKWTEFDFDQRVWIIPAERTQVRAEHRAPIARQAVEILIDLKRIAGRASYLFPGLRSANRPISENTMNAALLRMGYSKDEATAHVFRSTASTLLNESGRFSPDAIERALAHKDPDAIRGIYNRAQYWNDRVEMMQWWADRLDEIRAASDQSVSYPQAAK